MKPTSLLWQHHRMVTNRIYTVYIYPLDPNDPRRQNDGWTSQLCPSLLICETYCRKICSLIVCSTGVSKELKAGVKRTVALAQSERPINDITLCVTQKLSSIEPVHDGFCKALSKKYGPAKEDRHDVKNKTFYYHPIPECTWFTYSSVMVWALFHISFASRLIASKSRLLLRWTPWLPCRDYLTCAPARG